MVSKKNEIRFLIAAAMYPIWVAAVIFSDSSFAGLCLLLAPPVTITVLMTTAFFAGNLKVKFFSLLLALPPLAFLLAVLSSIF